MTYEEAKYWFNHNGADISQEIEMAKVINKALEKQIPKNVTHEATLYRCCTCPSCKNVVDEFIEFRGKRTLVQVSNCKYCGQALLWDDIEYEEKNK